MFTYAVLFNDILIQTAKCLLAVESQRDSVKIIPFFNNYSEITYFPIPTCVMLLNTITNFYIINWKQEHSLKKMTLMTKSFLSADTSNNKNQTSKWRQWGFLSDEISEDGAVARGPFDIPVTFVIS